jgi:hypothetical protein
MRLIISVSFLSLMLIGTVLAEDTGNTFKSVAVGFEVTKPSSWQ